MKKIGFKLLAGLLVAALVFSVFMPVLNKANAYAPDTYEIYLEDIDDFFTTEQRESLEELMRTTANAARCNLGIYVVSDLGDNDSVWNYAENALLKYFDDNSLVMVYYKDTSGSSPRYYSGVAARGDAENYSNKHSFELSTAINGTALAIGDVAAIEEFCEKLMEYGEKTYGSYDPNQYLNSSYDSGQYLNSDDQLLIKGDKYKAALADYDDCLTKAQEEHILNYMETTARKVKCNVGIVITRDIGNKTDVQYTEAFLDDNFGITSDSVVLLLLNTHDNPKYTFYQDWISLSGKAENKFQSHVEDIFDETYYALDKNGASIVTNFDSACLAFCDSVRMYGSFNFLRILLMFVHNPAATLMAIIFGIVVSLIVTSATVSKYKKKKPISAAQYIDRRTVNVTFRRDDFIREYTTSVRVDSNHHSGHHGGGGHSGGGHHGGGGGRHR
ncbi:MAG: TPM domain-containing protein [Oscillospiraceae bacterium]|nr:TPM domain-containing protein [Oscillospiraceae bacterium]